MKSKICTRTIIQMAICIGVLLMLSTACLKDCCQDPIDTSTPVLTTDTVSAITQTTAQCGGTITSDGGDAITARGVCWSIAQSPTIADSITTDSIGIGSFTSSITGLTSSTTYYVRAYATNSAGTGYGNQQTFSTLAAAALPILTTVSVTNITQTTATCGGTITSDGGSPVTERGVCWSTSPNPTTTDSKTSDGNGTGTFVSNLTGLTAGTYCYVRAYATNTTGTAYGNEQSFTTLPNITLPTVTTATISNVTQITFTSGGDVTSDGGTPVTAKGVCWSTVSDPTVSDLHTNDGMGTGSFISLVTNLQPNTFYFVRAYATNSIGTAYGNQVSCTTVADASPCPGVPTLTYGGQVYNTVMIGAQCWMRENLNIGTEILGSLDQTDNGTMEKYCYDDLTTNCEEYGGLYQWGEIVQYLNGASNTTTWNPVPTGHVQGICPAGWHLPTYDEYTILTTYLGGTSVAGGKMKEIGYTHWSAPNTDATNESGFTALPGGSRLNSGFFSALGSHASFWTTLTPHPESAWNIQLIYVSGNVYDGNDYKVSGNSVRCVKD